jgi:hypothetical protein
MEPGSPPTPGPQKEGDKQAANGDTRDKGGSHTEQDFASADTNGRLKTKTAIVLFLLIDGGVVWLFWGFSGFFGEHHHPSLSAVFFFLFVATVLAGLAGAGYNFWPHFGTICFVFVLLVALAAVVVRHYSAPETISMKEPAHEQTTEPKAPFTIKILGAIVAPTREEDGPFWLLYNSLPGQPTKLSPIFGALYIFFTNTKETPYMIDSFSIEAQTPSNRWEGAPSIHPSEGTIIIPATKLTVQGLVSSRDFQHARIIDFGQHDFFSNIAYNNIAPHATVSGWVLFQIPKAGFSNALRFRVTTEDDIEGIQTVSIVNGINTWSNNTDFATLPPFESNGVEIIRLTPPQYTNSLAQPAWFAIKAGETNLSGFPVEVIEGSMN